MCHTRKTTAIFLAIVMLGSAIAWESADAQPQRNISNVRPEKVGQPVINEHGRSRRRAPFPRHDVPWLPIETIIGLAPAGTNWPSDYVPQGYSPTDYPAQARYFGSKSRGTQICVQGNAVQWSTQPQPCSRRVGHSTSHSAIEWSTDQ